LYNTYNHQVSEGRSQLEILTGSVAELLHTLNKKLRDNEDAIQVVSSSIEGDLKSLLGWVVNSFQPLAHSVLNWTYERQPVVTSLIDEISEFARKQAGKPFLKRLLQGDEVTSSVSKYHFRLLHVYNVFNVRNCISPPSWYHC
jgi:hypothetical protein